MFAAHILIDLLQKHELAMAELYALFASQQTGHAAFWLALSSEERAHAEVLRQLRRLVLENKTVWDVSLFNADALQTSIEYTGKLISGAISHAPSFAEAAKTASAIEHGIIEANFFRS